MSHKSCCVVSCKNTCRKSACHFYKFPTASWKINQRKKWIAAVRRQKCFWAVALILVLSSAFLLTGMLHNRFLEMPTRITIENQYAVIKNLSFPAVTICSPNQVSFSAMAHFNRTLVDGNRTMNLESILPQLLGFYELIGDINKENLEYFQNLITLNRYNSLEVIGMMSQSCESFLKMCYFQRKAYPCTELFNPILTKHGMCCIFNSIYHYKNNKRNEKKHNFQPFKTSKTGIFESLTVVADYNPDDALHGTILLAGAIRVMFTDWTEFPADDQTNLVRPYSETFHIIHPTYTYCSEEVTTMPSWSRKCYFEDEYSQPHFHQYHNSDCDLLCEVQELERLCHCTMVYIPNVRMSHACNVSSINCVVDAKMQMNKWYSTEQCDCPRDCVSFQYRVEMSVGNLDALPYMRHQPYKDIEFNKTTSIMHFYIPSSVYTKRKQETIMSLISLSSNLGGVFGLCLGCSVISVVEIFFYIYLAIKFKIREHLNNFWNNRVNYTR